MHSSVAPPSGTCPRTPAPAVGRNSSVWIRRCRPGTERMRTRKRAGPWPMPPRRRGNLHRLDDVLGRQRRALEQVQLGNEPIGIGRRVRFDGDVESHRPQRRQIQQRTLDLQAIALQARSAHGLMADRRECTCPRFSSVSEMPFRSGGFSTTFCFGRPPPAAAETGIAFRPVCRRTPVESRPGVAPGGTPAAASSAPAAACRRHTRPCTA